MTPIRELQIKAPIAILFYAAIYAAVTQSVILGGIMMALALYAFRAVSRYEGWGG